MFKIFCTQNPCTYVLPRTLLIFLFMVPKPGVYQKDTNVEIALWPPFQPLLTLLQLGYF